MIAWCDLETTGTEEREDPILEAAVVLTTSTPDLTEVDRINVIFDPGEGWGGWRDRMDDYVFKMHTTNGLLKDIESPNPTEITPVNHPVGDLAISRWLEAHDDGAAFPLAGSGVAHFDARFIRLQLPSFSARLTYWTYDVGVLRRVLGLAGINTPKELTTSKTHRSMDDILLHIEEMRWCLAKLGTST